MSISPKQQIDLIDKIGRSLQSQMTTSTINMYLGRFGIPTDDVSMVNSKWSYVKELLKDIEIKKILDIAEDLDLDITDYRQAKDRISKDEISQLLKSPPQQSDLKRNVFVIHGRNNSIRQATFSLLRSIDLRPLEWSSLRSETGKTNPTIQEILGKAFSIAQAVVAVFTPDDISSLKTEFLKTNDPEYEKIATGQARPNVIFESGLAMGIMPERTIIVEIGKLRPFSDISGLHVVRMANSTEARQELANRLLDAGCSINLSGTDWHKAGNFQIAKDKPNSHMADGTHAVEGVEKGPTVNKKSETILLALSVWGKSASPKDVSELSGEGVGISESILEYLTDLGLVNKDPFRDGHYQLSRRGRKWLAEKGHI